MNARRRRDASRRRRHGFAGAPPPPEFTDPIPAAVRREFRQLAADAAALDDPALAEVLRIARQPLDPNGADPEPSAYAVARPPAPTSATRPRGGRQAATVPRRPRHDVQLAVDAERRMLRQPRLPRRLRPWPTGLQASAAGVEDGGYVLPDGSVRLVMKAAAKRSLDRLFLAEQGARDRHRREQMRAVTAAAAPAEPVPAAEPEPPADAPPAASGLAGALALLASAEVARDREAVDARREMAAALKLLAERQQQPPVMVDLSAQAPPTINVTVPPQPPPIVNVQPAEVVVNVAGQRPRAVRVEYDQEGRKRFVPED